MKSNVPEERRFPHFPEIMLIVLLSAMRKNSSEGYDVAELEVELLENILNLLLLVGFDAVKTRVVQSGIEACSLDDISNWLDDLKGVFQRPSQVPIAWPSTSHILGITKSVASLPETVSSVNDDSGCISSFIQGNY